MSDSLFQIPFAGGPDESTDPRLLPPGSVVSATNQVYDADGSYNVRYGLTMLPSGPSSVFRLAVFLFELLAIDALGGLWSCAPADSAFIQRDTLPAVQVTHSPLFNATSDFASWGEAVGSGYRVIAWDDSFDGGMHAAVYDATTGALVSSTKLTAGGPSASLYVSVGIVQGIAIVMAADFSAANIRAFKLTLASVGSGWSAGTIVSDGNFTSGSRVFAAAYTATAVYIAYEKVGTPSSVYLLQYGTSLTSPTAVSSALTAGTAGFTAMAIQATDGENVWVSLVATSTGYSTHTILAQFTSVPAFGTAFAMTPASNVTSAHVTRMGIERVSSTQCVVAMSSDPPSTEGTSYAQFTSGGQVGLAMGVNTVALASAPFYVSAQSTAYVLLFQPYIGLQNPGSFFLVDLLLGTTASTVMPRIEAVLAPGIVNDTGESSGAFFPIPRFAANGTAFETVAPIVRGSAGRRGMELFTVATASYSLAWAGGVTLGRELYVGGSYYDGVRAAEIGFPMTPQVPSLSNVTGSGSTYDYCITFGRIDAQGNLEESAPSPVNSVASGTTPNVTVTADCLWLTNKQRPSDAVTATAGSPSFVGILIYRTQKTSSGDTTFYRLNKDPVGFFNSQSATTVNFTDTLPDASLTDGTHPVLYTVSGELVHTAPESFTTSTVHKLRVWGIGADQATVWFSQTYSPGVMPAWNPANTLTVDDAGEPLTCLASLYDRLVIFTRSKIYVVFGDGPSAAGTGSDLTAPQRVPSSAGCIDPRSVVNTPAGIMFQSQRGIELLGPDLSVTFIGQPVSATTAAFPICVGACFSEATSTVRFAFTTAEAVPQILSHKGVAVLYDVRRGRWAVHSLTWGGTPSGASNAPLGALAVHPSFGVVYGHNDTVSGGRIYRENTAADATPWLDYGSFFVPLSVTTAWIKSGDLQGWQRVRRVRLLAQFYDAHQVNLRLNYDYQPTAELHQWNDVTIAGLAVNGWEQLRTIPAQGRCEAIQVTLATSKPISNPLGSGRGAGFTGLAFEIRPQKGGYRRFGPSAQT